MLKWRWWFWSALAAMLALTLTASAQQGVGSIRGVVVDKDFDVPLGGAEVSLQGTGLRTTTSDQGHFVFAQVPAGKYTLVFSKEGYLRQVKADVLVTAGQLTDVDAALSGEFTELDEFVVQDIVPVAGTEAALLDLRFESPSFMDSISADLMSRAGASDAATGLTLVAGATVQDGKFAVIRGLPDRYVNSQMNGVRLPSADEDTRAVQLDQFPSPVIESIRVSKTFTPDQQGDASGGAVDVRLKGIPIETLFLLKGERSYNSQVAGEDEFLTYEGGGVDTWGIDDSREIQTGDDFGNWDGAVGVSEDDAPIDYKWAGGAGGKRELDSGALFGGFGSFFYERDSQFFDDGIDDSLWVVNPGDPLTPARQQDMGATDFKTALFDVTQGTESVQWGGLGTLGIETEDHALGLTYLYTRIAEDTATLAEDTRGKAFFFPGYDPDDPSTPGHSEPDAAPYIRTETLEYTERTTGTLQLNGRHTLPDVPVFGPPELDWTLAHSTATLDQPDKRLFGTVWFPARGILPPVHTPFKPAAVFTLGNLQRIFKEIEEESNQYSLNLELPFEQWDGHEGYLKTGLFDDRVNREFEQETFSNASDNSSFVGDFEDFWSDVFPDQAHPIEAADVDVDYDGDQDVSAWYGMLDLPLTSTLSVIGGARVESTDIEIVNDPEPGATWFPKGAVAAQPLNPGDADVEFDQHDVLPALGLVFDATEEVTLRASYGETVARQTFKELTPILQQEFFGGPIFIGNPDLQMSALENYDLRVDYVPYEGALLSASWFYKELDNPIEYVQRIANLFTYTTPVNYPEGELTGYELEVRQSLGHFWESLEGLAVGGNATFIDSEVTLPDAEAADFASIGAPIDSRDATGAPEHLYNLYLTFDFPLSGTQFAIFYTVRGDTLIAGAAQDSTGQNFIPSIYAKEYGTLNLSLTQRLGEHFRLHLQAKNLTNPEIEEIYRSEHVKEGDVTRASYTKGIEYSIGLSVGF